MSIFLKRLISDFLGYMRDIRGYSETSIVTYEIALRQMFEVSEFYEEDSIWILDITHFRINIVENNKKTIAKKLSAVHSLVSYLQDQRDMKIKLISDEPVKVPKTLPKPIDEKYIREVLDSATLIERVIIEMLYGLGLRISELSSLRVESIRGGWIEVVGKGGKSRELPLLPLLRSTLDRYMESYAPQIYLFEKDTKAMNSAQLRYILTRCFKKRGIKATPHQLRHSFATHLLNSGARISDVSELLGHSSMSTTQLYTKLGDSKKLKEYLSAHPLVGQKAY